MIVQMNAIGGVENVQLCVLIVLRVNFRYLDQTIVMIVKRVNIKIIRLNQHVLHVPWVNTLIQVVLQNVLIV